MSEFYFAADLRPSLAFPGDIGIFTTERIEYGKDLAAEEALDMAEEPPTADINDSTRRYDLRQVLVSRLIMQALRNPSSYAPRPSNSLRPSIEDITQYSFHSPQKSLHAHFDNLNRTIHRQGLWLKTAYLFRHSCMNNACIAFGEDKVLMRATRNIEAGEEITINQSSFWGDYPFWEGGVMFGNVMRLGGDASLACTCGLCQQEQALTKKLVHDDNHLHARVCNLFGIVAKRQHQYQDTKFAWRVMEHLSELVTKFEDRYYRFPAHVVPHLAASDYWYMIAKIHAHLRHHQDTSTTAVHCLTDLGYILRSQFEETGGRATLNVIKRGVANKKALRCFILLWVAWKGMLKVVSAERQPYYRSLAKCARHEASRMFTILVGRREAFDSTYLPVVKLALEEKVTIFTALATLDRTGGTGELAVRHMRLQILRGSVSRWDIDTDIVSLSAGV